MLYSISELAKLAGISIRTLHYYDQIGLLKPTQQADSGYRYYDEEKLLILQQILFFKEIGLPLKKIATTLNRGNFDKIAALEKHYKQLKLSIKRTQKLLQTIEKTLTYLKGDLKMKTKKLYEGFDSKLQQDNFGEEFGKKGKFFEKIDKKSNKKLPP